MDVFLMQMGWRANQNRMDIWISKQRISLHGCAAIFRRRSFGVAEISGAPRVDFHGRNLGKSGCMAPGNAA